MRDNQQGPAHTADHLIHFDLLLILSICLNDDPRRNLDPLSLRLTKKK